VYVLGAERRENGGVSGDAVSRGNPPKNWMNKEEFVLMKLNHVLRIVILILLYLIFFIIYNHFGIYDHFFLVSKRKSINDDNKINQRNSDIAEIVPF